MWTTENRACYDGGKLRYPSDLTDQEWPLIEPQIPPQWPDCLNWSQTKAGSRGRALYHHWLPTIQAVRHAGGPGNDWYAARSRG